MKTYRFHVESIDYLYYDIEAEDEDEAYEIYRETDGGLFEPEACDWILSRIVELDEE